MNILLVDLSSIVHPAWHVHGADADVNATSDASIARVRAAASGYDHVAVCIDTGKSFRCDISAEYKAHREKKPESFHHQYARACDVLSRDGFLVVGAKGFEADDVIATIVAWAERELEDANVTILTGDKDLCQLVTERTTIVSVQTGEKRGPAEVAERFGVHPSQMLAYLSLVGDASDGVRGAPGVGPKTAARLIADHGSLVEIFSRVTGTLEASGFTPALYKSLNENGSAVALAEKLIALRTDAPIDCARVIEQREAVSLSGGSMPEIKEAEIIEDEETHVDQSNNEQQPAPTPQAVRSDVHVDDARTSQTAAIDRVEWSAELEPRTMAQAAAIAKTLHDSRLFSAYGTPQAIMAIVMSGREFGIGTMASLRSFHVVEGKVTMSSELLIALVLKSGKCEYFEPVELTQTHATYATKRKGRGEFKHTFSIEEAKQAGLVKDKSGWVKYPADMCAARCIARVARKIYPDVVGGLYCPEEF